MNGWMIRKQRGMATAMVVLFLPVILMGIAVALDGGRLMSTRYRIQTAVDIAALAAAGSVQWEELADGKVLICEKEANQQAVQYVNDNLDSLDVGDTENIDIWVVNASEEFPEPHPLTGNTLYHPTVVITCTVQGPDSWFALWRDPVNVSVEADASLRPRKD